MAQARKKARKLQKTHRLAERTVREKLKEQLLKNKAAKMKTLQKAGRQRQAIIDHVIENS